MLTVTSAKTYSDTGRSTPLMSSSLYAEYIKERENKHIVENERGFATYVFIDKGVYIQDIYVRSDFRHSGEAAALADQIANIAKEKGYNKMYGSVVPTANNSTSSLKVLLAYGFQLDSSTNNIVYLVKEI